MGICTVLVRKRMVLCDTAWTLEKWTVLPKRFFSFPKYWRMHGYFKKKCLLKHIRYGPGLLPNRSRPTWLIEELSRYNMTIQHRSGKAQDIADVLSRIPTTEPHCNCYDAGTDVRELPCGGCKYCQRAHKQWSRFEEVIDDVVPLAVRETKCCMEYSTLDKVTEGSNWWLFIHKELREAQENDQDLKHLLHWKTGSGPSEIELSLSGPAVEH